MDIKSLTSIDKFHLLSKNTLPEHGKFTQNRRFISSTVKSYGEKSKYIHYSETTDKIFCLPCGMFASNKKQLLPFKWMNGYSDWKNISVKGKKGLPYHLNSECHLSCHFQAKKFLDSMLSKKNEIARMVDSAKMKRISENNELLDAVIKNVRFCGVQGIGLRGHSEKFDTENPHKNRGNFLALMDLTGSYSDNLEKMLLSAKKQTQDGTRPQASMMSSSIQNELIDVFGNLVLKSILDDVKKAGLYVLIADEVTMFNKQFLSLCIRFVSLDSGEIKEEFLSFIEMADGTAESIFQYMLDELETSGLSIGRFYRGIYYCKKRPPPLHIFEVCPCYFIPFGKIKTSNFIPKLLIFKFLFFFLN